MTDSFKIIYKKGGAYEEIVFSAPERKLTYIRRRENLVSVDIELYDGYQKFITCVENFLSNAVPLKNEEKPGFRVITEKNSEYYVFSSKWIKCASSLVEILNEYTLFSELTNPVLIEE